MTSSLTDLRATLEHSVQLLEPGGRLERAVRLTGGVSAEVHRLDITTAAGASRRVVFRQHRSVDFKGDRARTSAKEHLIMEALHRAGFAVPEPYLIAGEDAALGPYIVVEWIPGSTEVATWQLPVVLQQMAQFLADVHTLDPGVLPMELLEPVEDPLTETGSFLADTEADDRIRAALTQWSADPNPPVLLHGDYWPGNVLWHDGELAAVIDWEDACLGSPLADLAGARVELLCQYGLEAMEQFTSRYLELITRSSTPLELEHLPVWETYVSAAALATMHTWGLEHDDEAHRRRATEQFLDRAAEELQGS